MDDMSSQRPLFSKDPSTLGFDLSAGNVWIYPENYPVREYQFSIVKKALFCNTLVCLPTGLGKTFIAAVIMYNFWRWYPRGKVVFLAPTKPLVAQQIIACHEIMGIPSEETIELTGNINQKQREVAWANKRVIFATAQTFHKDLEKNVFPKNLVKCLVIDEAHKALGKHSYCESVRLLSEENNYFRVLALSATPGDKISKVHEVVTSLRISNLELRDDSSPDVIPYINERKLDIILVRLSDELARFKDRYISVMDPHMRLLVRFNILRGDTGNVSKGRIYYLLQNFQTKTDKTGNYGQIIKTLNILLTMTHAHELLIKHGLRAFLHFYENHSDKFWMGQEVRLHELLEDVKAYLGQFPIIKPLTDGNVPDVPNNLVFGHNKFYKLKEVLERHFKSFRNKNEETRAIVFVEYRDIVNEVYVLLLQCRPLIRPQMFVGQAGQKQKEQILALEKFRSNEVNVLISTSVGEEGLDVGEVDLIVCFDISQSSPIRLVQRMGRTGRKRDGHIIVLVTDGKEHESLKTTMSKKDNLNNKVLKSHDIISALKQSPRMVPDELKPECRKMHLKIMAKTPKPKAVTKKKEVQKIKKKNVPKLVEPEPGPKNAGQSSIQSFFRTAKPGENPVDLNQSCLSQSHLINIKDANLYSDRESVEFLTLFAKRKSVDDCVLKFETKEGYIPVYKSEDSGFIKNLDIPNLSILDCLKSIPKVEETMLLMENQDMSVSQVCEENFVSDCFEKRSRFSEVSVKCEEVTIARSFVDVLYDSSSPELIESDEDAENKFEITRNFDDLLMDSTDESEIEEVQGTQNQEFSKKASFKSNAVLQEKFNFSKMLEGTSLDFINTQDLLESTTPENKGIVCEENPLGQLNESKNISYVSLASNCSGLTISQALEEIRKINANKSVHNLEKNNSILKIMRNSPLSKIVEDPSTSRISNFLSSPKNDDSSVRNARPNTPEFKRSEASPLSKTSKNFSIFKINKDPSPSKVIENFSSSKTNDSLASKINKHSLADKLNKNSLAAKLNSSYLADKLNSNSPAAKSNTNSPAGKLNTNSPGAKLNTNSAVAKLNTNSQAAKLNTNSLAAKLNTNSLAAKLNRNSLAAKLNRNSLVMKKGEECPESQLITDSPESSEIEDVPESIIIEDSPKETVSEKEMPSVSNVQKQNYLLDILNSDEDFFNEEFDDIVWNEDKCINPSENKGSNDLKKTEKDATQACQITRVNSNIDHENLFNALNDDDWGSDFEVSMTEISSPKYFKKDEIANSSKANKNPSEGTVKEILKNSSEGTLNEIKKNSSGGALNETLKNASRGTSNEIKKNSSGGTSNEIKKNSSGGALNENLKNASRGTLNENLKNASGGTSNEIKKNSSGGALNENLKNTSRGTLNENLKNASGGTSNEIKKNSSGGALNENLKNASRGTLNEIKTNSSEGTSNGVNSSQPPKKFSLFKWNSLKKPSEKIASASVNSNDSVAGEKSNEVEVFKKPTMRSPFSLKRSASNAPSTSNCKTSWSLSSSNKMNSSDNKISNSSFNDKLSSSSINNKISSSSSNSKISSSSSNRISSSSSNKDSSSSNNKISSNSSNKNSSSSSNNKINSSSINNKSSCSSSNKSRALIAKVNDRMKSPEPSLASSSDESPEIRRKIKRRKGGCKFIDNEADVSVDGGVTSEGTSGEDEDLDGFVSYTQNVQDQVDMRAHYLKSVRSPARRPGAFLIKKNAHFQENVYSQPISQFDNTYLHDSFCVKEDEIEYEDETDDDLEITFEQLSEETVNKNKRKREKSPVFRINKRKRKKGRIQNLNNSSSEDEAEHMRKQILEESFLLKKKR